MKRFTQCSLAMCGFVACLASALGVLGLIGFAGPRAGATPPVAPLAAALVTASGDYGTIKGRLVWGGATLPAPKAINVDKDTSVCGKGGPLVDRKLVVDPKTKGVKWGIAYLVKPNGSNPEALKALVEKHPQVEIDQKFCEYTPYVVGLVAEQGLLLKSSDEVNHNVHLNAFTNEAFNIILPPNGQLTKKLVAEKRAMKLTCDIHGWMEAWIFAFDHPFFAVTGDDGSFEIKGVPAGAQKLVVWQPEVGYVTTGGGSGMAVTAVADKTTDVGDLMMTPRK